MPLLANQTISKAAKEWIKKEAARLTEETGIKHSEAEIVRRLLDAAASKG